MDQLLVLAIGGNSLILDPQKSTIPDQYEASLKTAVHIAQLVKEGYRIVITHGNGPQVGFILRRSELAEHEVHPVPLDYCVADTQGSIGYMLQKGLHSFFSQWENPPQVATIVTQVVVEKDDPAFQNPTKPIGSFFDEETARKREKEDGWNVVEDAGRGFRRVVPSPHPKEIIELAAISHLVNNNFVVIAGGGGGVPVVRQEDGTLVGIEAVIDKDRLSALMATQLDAERLIISTAIDKVYLNFGKNDQKGIDEMNIEQAEHYIAEGHFAKGSMLPKIEACISFLKNGGKEALITSPELLSQALQGKAGTRIIP